MTGAPALARVHAWPSCEVASKIAGPPPSSAVPEYHITYAEATFWTDGSSTLSESCEVERGNRARVLRVGCERQKRRRQGQRGGWPAPEVARVLIPTGPNAFDW